MSRSPLRRIIALSVASLALPFVGGLLGPALAAPPIAAAVAGKPYSLTVAKVVAQKGQAATARVVIKPAAGYHMNKDFPTSLKLTPPADVKLDKASLGKEDASLTEQEVAFDVKLTAGAAGNKVINGDLRFAVCTETTCDPQKTPVAIDVEVK